jgi:hypothetical protein
MQRWSGYARHVRDERDRLIWIARLRCTGCGVTHALLPSFVLPGRWDAVAHIGKAVELAGQGRGHRPIAIALARPEATVRGWLRRVRSVAASLAATLLGRAVALGWTGWELPVAPPPRLVAAVHALASRWPGIPTERWSIAVLVTGGRLLPTNTTPPLERTPRSGAMAGPSQQEVSDGP